MNSLIFNYNQNNFIFYYNELDKSGLWCIDEIVRDNYYKLDLFSNIKSGHFIDIGANCGVATIILAKQNPESTIYSFEPDPNLFENLKKNVTENNLTNVKLFNYAVTKNNINSLELYFHPLYTGGNTTYSDLDAFNNYFNKETNFINVNAISLDDIIKTNNIDTIKLLKIDCEGAEYDIISDSQEFKRNKIENMVGEFHNLIYNTKVTMSAEELLTYSKKYINGICEITILNV